MGWAEALLKGLPMDEASRMARALEMGFDVDAPLYHATKYDFPAFVPSPYRGASYFADTPDGALRGASAGSNEFGLGGPAAPGAESGGLRVMPVMTRGRIYGRDPLPEEWFPESLTYGDLRKIYDRADDWAPSAPGLTPDEVLRARSMRSSAASRVYEEAVPESEFWRYSGEAENDLPLRRAKIPAYPYQGPGMGWESLEGPDRAGFRDFLQKIGYAGAKVSDESGDAVAIFDPRNIRSRFAAFDPAKADSADLLASRPPVPVPSAPGEQPQREESTLARLLGRDTYVSRSVDGLKRGASALADFLTRGASAGIEDMQAALSGYRVPQGAVLTDAGYVMPENLARGNYDSAAEREPDVMRALTLMGGAMSPVRGAGIAAKAGAEAKAAASAAHALPMDEASRMQRAQEQGYNYFRRSRSTETPDNGVGFSMFAEGADPAQAFDNLRGYGPGKWMASADGAVDVVDLQKDMVRALYRAGYNRQQDAYGRSAAELPRVATPQNIVDHAGLWDSPELVEVVYRDVLEPRGVTAVRTNDGLLSFGHPNVRSADAAFDPARLGDEDYMASYANLGPLANALMGRDERKR